MYSGNYQGNQNSPLVARTSWKAKKRNENFYIYIDFAKIFEVVSRYEV
jgi:hypothetical protein